MNYNDISPATQAYVDRALLKRAQQNNILGQFGQNKVLPSKSTKTMTMRRYNRLAVATTPLTEGVTPTGKTLTKTDISVSIQQYGDFVTITDVILDTHTDPVLQESQDILGEQAGETWDVLRFGVLKAGTNVLYANGTTRAGIISVVSRDQLRTAVRVLKKQLAKPITNIIKAGPNIGTSPIPKAFVLVCHSDAQPDFERMEGWKSTSEYASSMGMIEGEAGSVGEIRVVFDNNCTPWADIGAAVASTGNLSTTGTNTDVYPMLIFGADAYGTVALAGKNAVSTFVNNPKSITGDELAQRGSVGWKGWTATVILQDAFMLRIETALKG